MTSGARPGHIVVAEDDPDDQLLIRLALKDAQLAHELRIVADGEQLLAYLRHEPPFEDAAAHPRPSLVLLDFDLPRMDGRQALTAIRADPQLRSIPVVVLTASTPDADVRRAYDLGANSYIAKPATFEGLAEVLRGIGRYWFGIVELPEGPAG